MADMGVLDSWRRQRRASTTVMLLGSAVVLWLVFAAVLFGTGEVNVISTRRFFVRPATVLLEASGFDAPMPFA